MIWFIFLCDLWLEVWKLFGISQIPLLTYGKSNTEQLGGGEGPLNVKSQGQN